MASLDGRSRVLLGMATILAVMGLAGLSSPSFAYDLMLGLAALFGASAGLNIFAMKSSSARWSLFGFVVVLAFSVTYVYVVSRAGGPPGSKPTLTPWVPIAIALLAMTGAGLLVRRATRNTTIGLSTAFVVMAVILAVFAQIATVAYVPAALLAIMALVGFGSAGRHSARGRKTMDARFRGKLHQLQVRRDAKRIREPHVERRSAVSDSPQWPGQDGENAGLRVDDAR